MFVTHSNRFQNSMRVLSVVFLVIGVCILLLEAYNVLVENYLLLFATADGTCYILPFLGLSLVFLGLSKRSPLATYVYFIICLWCFGISFWYWQNLNRGLTENYLKIYVTPVDLSPILLLPLIGSLITIVLYKPSMQFLTRFFAHTTRL